MCCSHFLSLPYLIFSSLFYGTVVSHTGYLKTVSTRDCTLKKFWKYCSKARVGKCLGATQTLCKHQFLQNILKYYCQVVSDCSFVIFQNFLLFFEKIVCAPLVTLQMEYAYSTK